MDVPVIVGLILALALSGTFGLFKKEREQIWCQAKYYVLAESFLSWQIL